jgi:hypothetical protein
MSVQRLFDDESPLLDFDTPMDFGFEGTGVCMVPYNLTGMYMAS